MVVKEHKPKNKKQVLSSDFYVLRFKLRPEPFTFKIEEVRLKIEKSVSRLHGAKNLYI